MYLKVRVPATTANMGPGFDCLAMALTLYNEVLIEEGAFRIEITGEGQDIISKGKDNQIYRSIDYIFSKLSKPVPDLQMKCHNNIPLFRGLGSSAAAIVAGLNAGNALCGRPFGVRELNKFAYELEGHPDNVVAASLGGCQIAILENEELYSSEVPLPADLLAVVYIPEFKMPTAKSRAILPHEYSRADAVYNISRAALLVNCLIKRQYDLLNLATRDRLHQPARGNIFPEMATIFESALNDGALGVFLSGGGSSILAFATDNAKKIGNGMKLAGEKLGLSGSIKILQPCKEGCVIEYI